jgi:hypothetical protein
MTDYVLIHGAWHGSWCCARVRRLLAAGAHRVTAVTPSGSTSQQTRRLNGLHAS